MPEPEGARVTELAAIVNVDLDYCIVDDEVVGFHIIAFFLDETRPHGNVLMTKQQTITTGSLISHVSGDQGAGIVSGVSQGTCTFKRHGSGRRTVKINDEEVVSVGDFYDMNCGFTGAGNCEGIVSDPPPPTWTG